MKQAMFAMFRQHETANLSVVMKYLAHAYISPWMCLCNSGGLSKHYEKLLKHVLLLAISSSYLDTGQVISRIFLKKDYCS